MFDLKVYTSPAGMCSCYKGVPIEYLDLTRKIMKSKGYSIRIKYRGPRATHPLDTRNRFAQKAGCLKRCATTFTVYPA